jgi:DNA gyrase subunit A
MDELAEREREIADLQAILADPVRQRQIIGEELGEIVGRYGDERRTRLVPFEGDMSAEDLITQEDVVVTVTRGGYAKRTRTDLYRSQRRGGRGVRGAALRQDDLVEHFFVTTTHHWILFFTNKGRVYRAKAHELPEANRDGRGSHVANVLAFQPDEKIAQVLAVRDYDAAPYLVLATRGGIVKKTSLTQYDNGRSNGLIAVNLREDDELIGAALVAAEDDLLLVSRGAQSIRFQADDEALRPMGRDTSGVRGMALAPGDEVLALQVVPAGEQDALELLVVSDGGYGKRTPLGEYRRQGRGGSGILTAKFPESRGTLVGAMVASPQDEVFAITSAGVVIRVPVESIRRTGRGTQGVKLMALDDGATIVAVAHNAEAQADEQVEQVADRVEADATGNAVGTDLVADADGEPVAPVPDVGVEDELVEPADSLDDDVDQSGGMRDGDDEDSR